MPAPVPLPVAVLPVPPAPWLPMLVPDEPLIEPSLLPEVEPPDIEPEPDMLPEPDDIEPELDPRCDRELRCERALRVEVPVDEPMLDWVPEPIVESVPIEPLPDWPLPIEPVPVPVVWPLPMLPPEPPMLPPEPVEPVCAMARAGTASAPSAKILKLRIICLLLKSGPNSWRNHYVPTCQPDWARCSII